MANANLTAGDGTIVAGTDEIAGVKYVRAKSTWGPTGTVNDTDVATGKPMPVQLRGSDGTDRSNSLPVVLGTGTASIGKLAANTPPVYIGDVGVTSVTPGGAAANLGKAEDSLHTTGDTGVMVLGVRQDSQANFATDGDYVPLSIDGTGGVRVGGNVVVTAAIPGTGATSLGKAEDAIHNSGDTGVMTLAVRQDTQVDFGADGDYVPLSIDANGALRVSGAGGGTQFAEDSAHITGDIGTMMLAVRQDTQTDFGADGDYVPLSIDADGAVRTVLSPNSPGIITSVAHGSVDAGDPIKVGAKAVAGVSGVTLVDAADRSDLYSGLDGVQIVRPHCGLEDIVSGNASNTDGTSTSVITAAGVGIKQYLTSVVLTNTSSSNIYVEMKSGTTVKSTIPLPANGGAIFNPPVPLPPNAANEAWNFDPSAAATTVYCTAIGFKSKV